MKTQNVFKRYEIKYMLTEEQVKVLLSIMEPYMRLDKFGKSTIRNIYYDTPDFILARHSIAKPVFKEKLRVRSYELTTDDSKVFVELKRKFDSIVYKRRLSVSNIDAMRWLGGHRKDVNSSFVEPNDNYGKHHYQLGKEIEYFISYYENLRPAVFLSYDREAYRMKNEEDKFRVTFDRNVIYRDYDINLNSDVYGTELLEQGSVLMELKCPGGIPIWMVKVLSELKIYKTSFSKYGTAYRDIMQIMNHREMTNNAIVQENITELQIIEDKKEEPEYEYTSRKHIRYANSNNQRSTIRNGFGSGTRARTGDSTHIHA